MARHALFTQLFTTDALTHSLTHPITYQDHSYQEEYRKKPLPQEPLLVMLFNDGSQGALPKHDSITCSQFSPVRHLCYRGEVGK